MNLLLLAALLAALPAAAIAAPPPAGPIVTTDKGKVQGSAGGGVQRFLGIPYGADTGGAHRFGPPRPAAAWHGVRPATRMGPRCPQLTHKASHDILRFSDDPTSEDCLVLNVWTPIADAGKRPVMVWIHGGGYGFGAANDVYYDGTSLASHQDVVVVSLNHRLNALGYLDLGPEAGADLAATANVGQLDIVQALRWVRTNIARFGGDPANVTLFGQSGGGAKISLLMAMPSAEGLFAKAIIQSGAAPLASTPAEALAQRDRLLAQLGLTPADVRKLRDVPIAELTAAIDKVGVLSFGPWVDGAVLPRQPFAPDAPATARHVPLLIGTARDEATDIAIANRAWLAMDEPTLRVAITPLVGAPRVDRALALYKARRPGDPAPQLFASVLTDSGFTHPAQVLASRQAAAGAPVWMYRTDWQSPVMDGVLRAPHGVELPFVFDTVEEAPGLVGTAPQPAMVAMFQRTFAAFARTGDPNAPGLPAWPRFDTATRRTFVYDTQPHVIADPEPSLRALWDEATGQSSAPR